MIKKIQTNYNKIFCLIYLDSIIKFFVKVTQPIFASKDVRFKQTAKPKELAGKNNCDSAKPEPLNSKNNGNSIHVKPGGFGGKNNGDTVYIKPGPLKEPQVENDRNKVKTKVYCVEQGCVEVQTSGNCVKPDHNAVLTDKVNT